MKPVDQVRFDPGDGDCHSAAICSILELELPTLTRYHHALMARARAQREQLTVDIDTAVQPEIELQIATGHALVRPAGHLDFPIIPTGFSIANGMGPRGRRHSCVAFDGQVVHDPHPDRTGLIEISDFELLAPVLQLTTQSRLWASKHGPFVPPPPPSEV